MKNKELKEEEIVMCTVKRIEGTNIFVEIEENGEGSIVMSEVAAGRIRNIREYVSPNKKIVCKILKILPNNIQLSLRRVTGKEREEIQQRYKKERSLYTLLKSTIPSPESTIEKIRESFELWEFYEKLKENPSIIENFTTKEQALSISKKLIEKKEKEKNIRKIFILKSAPLNESTVNEIKSILSEKNIKINYLGSSQFSISSFGKDFKEAGHNVDMALERIEKQAKEKKLFFELKEK